MAQYSVSIRYQYIDMKPIYIILATAFSITLSCPAFAQQGQKLPTAPLSAEYKVADKCSNCDSLGDEYLQAGDTSMALYYYQAFLDANPHEEQIKTAINKFRKLYISYNQSFYLKEY